MFNYEKYCHDVIDTSEKLLKKVTQITIETEQSFAVNSKTYKVRRSSKSPQHYLPDDAGRRSATPKHEPTWKSTSSSKGAFYFEGEFLISHQYNMEITERQQCEIS